MTNRPEASDPLWRWVDAHLNGVLADNERRQLEERLNADSDAREFYLEYCELHCDMLFGGASSDVTNLTEDTLRLSRELYLKCCDLQGVVHLTAGASHGVDGQAIAPDAGANPSPITPQSNRLIDRDRWYALVSMVAVCATIVAGISINGWREERLANSTAVSLPQPASPGGAPYAFDMRPTVAMVTGLQDCAWEHASYKTGEGVSAGATLDITTGQAKLTYENGVELVLQSPCSVTTISSHRCRVHSGSVSLSVPESMNGFTVETDVAEVTDLGATYGVTVNARGGMELHVFKGEAVLWKLDSMQREVHVVAGQSVAVSERMKRSPIRKAQPSRFSRHLIPEYKLNEAPNLPAQEGLALWLAGDMHITADDQGRVVTWHDIISKENDTNEDAWQNAPHSRPAFVPHAINGMPAVRFDGKSNYLETAPLRTTQDQTVFLVFSRASDFEKPVSHTDSLYKARQLISYNGPVHSRNDQSRVSAARKHALQICDRLESGRYWGRVWAIRGEGQNSLHLGSIKSRTKVPVNSPVVLCYCYHPSNNVAALYINGQRQGVDTAPIGREYTSRKVIGRSCMYPAFFDGDIGEILIYNSAVDADSLDAVHRYLGERYSIPVLPIKEPLVSPLPSESSE